MKNFKKILVVALAVVLCFTALSVTTLADGFNPTVKISARFDEKGEKLIASVVTTQECGAIEGTLTFSEGLTFDKDSTSFVEDNNDTKYVSDGNTIKFVILANDMTKGDTHWADFYFTVGSATDVTFDLSEVVVCDVNENLLENGIEIEKATVTLTANELQTLGAQYREENETDNVKSALRFGSKLEIDMKTNVLGEGKTAVRCGYIAGFAFKVNGAELKATDFDKQTGKFTAVTVGAINKQAKYYLDKGDNYIIYTYAVTGFGKGTQANGDQAVENLPIVARPYVVYYDANEEAYGIEYGAQISKSYAEVQAISDLINKSESYEK